MSAFLTHLIPMDLDSGPPITLAQPLVYESDRLARTIIVPSGFVTDLASIPRGLWNIIPKEGKQNRAGVIHDWLYMTAEEGCTRKGADDALREGCLCSGVSARMARVIWLGVRLGGWVVWRRYRRARPLIMGTTGE